MTISNPVPTPYIPPPPPFWTTFRRALPGEREDGLTITIGGQPSAVGAPLVPHVNALATSLNGAGTLVKGQCRLDEQYIGMLKLAGIEVEPCEPTGHYKSVEEITIGEYYKYRR